MRTERAFSEVLVSFANKDKKNLDKEPPAYILNILNS